MTSGSGWRNPSGTEHAGTRTGVAAPRACCSCVAGASRVGWLVAARRCRPRSIRWSGGTGCRAARSPSSGRRRPARPSPIPNLATVPAKPAATGPDAAPSGSRSRWSPTGPTHNTRPRPRRCPIRPRRVRRPALFGRGSAAAAGAHRRDRRGHGVARTRRPPRARAVRARRRPAGEAPVAAVRRRAAPPRRPALGVRPARQAAKLPAAASGPAHGTPPPRHRASPARRLVSGPVPARRSSPRADRARPSPPPRRDLAPATQRPPARARSPSPGSAVLPSAEADRAAPARRQRESAADPGHRVRRGGFERSGRAVRGARPGAEPRQAMAAALTAAGVPAASVRVDARASGRGGAARLIE